MCSRTYWDCCRELGRKIDRKDLPGFLFFSQKQELLIDCTRVLLFRLKLPYRKQNVAFLLHVKYDVQLVERTSSAFVSSHILCIRNEF